MWAKGRELQTLLRNKDKVSDWKGPLSWQDGSACKKKNWIRVPSIHVKKLGVFRVTALGAETGWILGTHCPVWSSVQSAHRMLVGGSGKCSPQLFLGSSDFSRAPSNGHPQNSALNLSCSIYRFCSLPFVVFCCQWQGSQPIRNIPRCLASDRSHQSATSILLLVTFALTCKCR